MMYTVTCNYSATGEGHTYMVLYTTGCGPEDDLRANAMATFKKIFGDYFAIGAEVQDGMVFDFPGSKLLIGDQLKATLEDWVKDAGSLEYYASLHVNFS